MPKIKMICPHCGSDDVTRDCLGRWSVKDQKWEVSSELDSMQCEACDREIGSDGFDEVPVEANTRDIGLAITSFLEGRRFSIHQENEDGGRSIPSPTLQSRRSTPPIPTISSWWSTADSASPSASSPAPDRRLGGVSSAVLSADQGARMPLTRGEQEQSDR